MSKDKHPTPRHYLGVMVSSTFTDLVEHRAALIKAIKGQGLTDLAMENDSAKPAVDVIESSLQMVRDASAYIGVISHKYGQTLLCPQRNPKELSLTELEFNEALRLKRPILLFVMGDGHSVHKADVEIDPVKTEKLKAFRERAKQMKPESPVQRVFKVFNDIHEFEVAATQSVADLRRYLDEQEMASSEEPTVIRTVPDPIPTPPTFYAEPPYIGSHEFIGRRAELEVLSDWAVPADAHPILLFDAIGGSGKSILTWEWTTKHATQVRTDWAGLFWYSFYERGAVMADFCRRALAYITGRPLDDFKRIKTPELADILLHHLQARPWLFVLDGLERVLVAYHRYDAAQVPDDEANQPTDQIANRDPCAAIRPEDDDLLRSLAAAAPSKLLVTSRLAPRILLNQANQAIPGVLRVTLPGLRPADAEALVRSCSVHGNSQEIQNYLKSHCDCHPLVTGVLGGLISHYLPDKGNFDAWAADPNGGNQLNLANLDLNQKRNNILNAALGALPEKGRQLLSTLALLPEAVDFPVLSALNPHLPPEPIEVKNPHDPRDSPSWKRMSDVDKKKKQQEYQAALLRWQRYEQTVKDLLQSPASLAAPQKLADTVHDLEQRGLLQYDDRTKRYDLHPVVRGIAAGGLGADETIRYGQRVVDFFSQQAHSPYELAETLEDVRAGLHIVRTLLKMGRYQQAYEAYIGQLSIALCFNLEAHTEVLSLLRPFFPHGWASLPSSVSELIGTSLTTNAALALYYTGETKEALAAYGGSLLNNLNRADWRRVRIDLHGCSFTLADQNRLAKRAQCLQLTLDIATLTDDKQEIFKARLTNFSQLATIGRWVDAEAMWQLLNPMGRTWSRNIYRPGDAEISYAFFLLWKGDLTEEHLAHTEQLAKEGRNRMAIRDLHSLRGEWRLEQGKWALAAESLHEAVRMARAVEIFDATAETQLVFAKFHLQQLSDPRREVEQVASARRVSNRALAELWLAIGDLDQAKKHALAAYKWAWADGEPYVHRYELDKAIALLKKLGVEIPNLPRYDATKDEKLPWEDAVVAAIEKLRAEKQKPGN